MVAHDTELAVRLNQSARKSRYFLKDLAKARRATKFVGRGSPASSTEAYRKAAGDLANSGRYTATDRVFVSAEGSRAGRLTVDWRELRKAIDASATIITDIAADRQRSYNIGEREVAVWLVEQGYAETAPGSWTPIAMSSTATSVRHLVVHCKRAAYDVYCGRGRDPRSGAANSGWATPS